MMDKQMLTGRKLFLFKALTLLVPFILLLFLELSLRFGGYGHNTNLFVKYSKDERFMQMNPYASERFFSDTINATKGSSEIFEVKKAPNTLRIFVLGESTTIGYPYFHNGAFHRWLQYRLMQMYPDRNFEIINTAITAVNSYTLLDFSKQLIQYQPDAIMIYSGHNEYYGALGIGSTSYLGSNRFLISTLLKLRELKLVQLLNNASKKVTGIFENNQIDTRETLMKRMAARQRIPYGSEDYQTGLEQFNKNMNEVCRLFSDEKIPVFLSTIVSNEKDLPPFISNGSGKESAAYFFKLGQLEYKKRNFKSALQYFVKAKQLDELRFRAPEEINSTIKKIAANYKNVYLVDTKKLFQEHSLNGILGSETLLEHVHPNLYGYAIMSEAFYQAFEKQHLVKGIPQRKMTFDELRREMPLLRMDSLNGEYQIRMLKSGWPFNQPVNNSALNFSLQDSLAQLFGSGKLQWKDAMEQLFELYKKANDQKGALKIVEAMTLEYPQSEQFCGLAASMNADLHRYEMAALYYKKLQAINPSNQVTPRVIKLYLRSGEPEMALASVKDLPEIQQAKVTTILKQIVADKRILKSQADDKQAIVRIAANYKLLGIADSLVN
jgi:tetratricopeptide (TPR) repeat protein